MADMGTIAALGLALYAGHHVGDYWVQTDHQAQHKGTEHGARECLAHVLSYLATQAACVGILLLATGARLNVFAFLGALALSGVTHYLADRREFGIMFRLARLLPGKARFLLLGVPRKLTVDAHGVRHDEDGPVMLDNPSLGTGGWALDQSWHIFFGVFLSAIVAAL